MVDATDETTIIVTVNVRNRESDSLHEKTVEKIFRHHKFRKELNYRKPEPHNDFALLKLTEVLFRLLSKCPL